MQVTNPNIQVLDFLSSVWASCLHNTNEPAHTVGVVLLVELAELVKLATLIVLITLVVLKMAKKKKTLNIQRA